MPPCLLVQTTPTQPGAIAILQLIGDSAAILRTLTGIDDWPIGRARLASFEDIDEGLAGRPAPDVTQLMPHGGPRVVSRLTRRLIELGAQPSDADVDPERVYPEAADRCEALALAAVARAHSPLAIELLLDQPRRWRAQPALSDSDLTRSRRLNRLIDPPIVVVAGPANVGKSTLSNALLGRSMSIALDLPGTTRDYTTGRIELAGLVADWYDTPGLRQADDGDSIEAKALDLAQRLIERADLLIAMTDHDHAWPALSRDPDIHVINKIDLGKARRHEEARRIRRRSRSAHSTAPG